MTSLNLYLNDAFNQLVSKAIDIKNISNDDFDKGKLFAYHEVLSRLLNLAEAFNIMDSLPENIRDFDPDCLLK